VTALLRDRLASIKLQLDAIDRSRDEMADLALKRSTFHRLFVLNGLLLTTRQNEESLKSSYRTARSTAQFFAPQ